MMDTLHNTERLLEVLFAKIEATSGEILYHGISDSKERWGCQKEMADMAVKLTEVLEAHEEWWEDMCKGNPGKYHHKEHDGHSGMMGRTAKTTPAPGGTA